MKNVGVWIAAGCALAVVTALSLRYPAQAAPPFGSPPPAPSSAREMTARQKWLLTALTKAESLRPGMTRRDVIAEFTPTPFQMTAAGQAGDAARRTFASKECPLIKVEFEFLPARFGAHRYWQLQDRSSLWAGHKEQSDDVVVGISRPILAH